ncbi:MAG: hypothetical protein EA339_13645 [Rhodobacteraceae bacterium]|nr:MAG: hypothetical protein EA339_13645 [Paracoccaceae bacterium]
MPARPVLIRLALAAIVAVAAVAWLLRPPSAPAALSLAEMVARHATPLPRPAQGMASFHLGHSLVGAEIPAFTQQLAEAAGFAGASYASQLGWGTSLRDHWDRDRPINGFAEMNTSAAHRDPRAALESGAYDALILTEMVDLRDAIRWHQSGPHVAKWAALARAHRPDIRVFLYETWHATDSAEGWLDRLDADLPALWQGTIMAQAMAAPEAGVIHLIPAGQVMAAFTRALEAQGGLPGLADRYALFAESPDGARDTIHPNDLGAYLVALTHVATLYQIDPRGLPFQLMRADGSAADAPSADVAALMQQVVWDVTRSLPQTGIAP